MKKQHYPKILPSMMGLLVALSGCAGTESRNKKQAEASKARIEIGRITSKQLIIKPDSQPSPMRAGIEGGGISGGSKFGGIGLGIDLGRLFDRTKHTSNVYEYEITTVNYERFKIKSNIDLQQGDCAKAVIADQDDLSTIAVSTKCGE